MTRRGIMFWLVIAFFAVFVLLSLSDLRNLGGTLSRGNLWWIVVAALMQVVYFWLVAIMYRESMRIVGVPYRILEMLPVVLGSIFVSGVTPAGEAGGFALFIDDARARGSRGALAAAGALLGQLGYYTGLSVTLAIGFFYLIATGRSPRSRCSARWQ